MLAPRISNAFICIRCELKLAQSKTFSLTRPPHATFSSASRRTDAFDDAFSKPADASIPRQRAKLSVQPLGKVRRRKGRSLRESTPQLAGVKSLGKDAQILVLREVGDAPQERAPLPTDDAAVQEEDAPKIFASLQAENNKVSQEEINSQLETLRPRAHSEPGEPHYITLAAFLNLTKTLNKSFTVQQLSKYYSVTKGVQEEFVKKEVLERLKSSDPAEHVLERTQWYPGTSNLRRRLPGLSAAKGPKRRPIAKPLLVDQILRDIWNIVLLEEIEAAGEIELTVKPWQISLLNANNAGENSSALDHIGLNRKAKIEAFLPHSTLRITADKSSAEYAANDVEQLLRTTKTETFPLKPWVWALSEDSVQRNTSGRLVNLFPQDAFQLVGNQSGTTVQNASEDAILIRGFSHESIQEAQRLLIGLLPLKPRYTHTLDKRRVDMIKAQKRVLPTIFDQSLKYRLRGSQLGRWIHPVEELPSDLVTAASESASNNPDGQASYADVLATLKNYADSVPQVEARGAARIPSKGGATWHVNPDTKLTADFGQVLFPADSKAVQESSTSVSAFTNSIPGIAKVLSESDYERPHSALSILEYEFLPAVKQPERLKRSQDYPRLSLRFSTSRTPELLTVGIKFNELYHDVLLPDHGTDIRFKAYQRLRLRSPLMDPSIREFAAAVCANIASGARLTAPPSLTIEIPEWVIPGQARDSTTTRQAVYQFTGIKWRQFFNSRFHDFPLAYGTVKSNKLDGEGGQLSAYFHHYTRRAQYALDEQARFDEFVKTSFDIANLVTKAAGSQVIGQERNKRMRPEQLSEIPEEAIPAAKPRDQQSARRLRRANLAQTANSIDTDNDLAGLLEPRVTQTIDSMTVPDLEQPFSSSSDIEFQTLERLGTSGSGEVGDLVHNQIYPSLETEGLQTLDVTDHDGTLKEKETAKKAKLTQLNS